MHKLPGENRRKPSKFTVKSGKATWPSGGWGRGARSGWKVAFELAGALKLQKIPTLAMELYPLSL